MVTAGTLPTTSYPTNASSETTFAGSTSGYGIPTTIIIDGVTFHGGIIEIKNLDIVNGGDLEWSVDSMASVNGTNLVREKDTNPVPNGGYDSFPLDGRMRSKYVITLTSVGIPTAYEIEAIRGV